jgi:hypothetical protein
MIRALIPVDNRLASGIALRYACRLANRTGMDLQAIYIEEPEHEDRPPGTGWVKRTWEKGLLVSAGAEISQLIDEEKPSCPMLRKPKMFVGDREAEILRELDEGAYDLFIEGALYAFNASNFLAKFSSGLYEEASCPILVVKNLVELKKAAVLLEDTTDLWSLIPSFFKTLEGADLEFDLVHVKPRKPGRLTFREGKGGVESAEAGEADERIASARKMLAEAGWSPRRTRVVRGVPTGIADSLKDYGLVAASLPRQTDGKSVMLELLSRVPSAVLVCRQ